MRCSSRYTSYLVCNAATIALALQMIFEVSRSVSLPRMASWPGISALSIRSVGFIILIASVAVLVTMDVVWYHVFVSALVWFALSHPR